MTNAAKAVMWSATWTPWGAPHAITGAAVLDARFPGQWFQLESSLHYNWHRHYDPTLGRYTQPDPLGFVDGPSVYGYAVGSPGMAVDPDGRLVWTWPAIRLVVQFAIRNYAPAAAAAAIAATAGGDKRVKVWGPNGPELWDPDDLPSPNREAQSSSSGGNGDCDEKFSRAMRRCHRVWKDDYWAINRCIKKALERYKKCCDGR
jgi:RHS repeat-associated protein